MTRKGYAVLAALLATTAVTPAMAGTVLIINGATGTLEANTTASITTQISQLHVAAGNTITVVDTVPVSLAGYQQVWDLRFSNTQAITASQQSQYLSYLQGGGGMFVMGENSNFAARNSSILSLISAAGGGSLAFTTPGDAQTVYSPFTGPNAVTSIVYNAAGGVNGFGTGQWITSNAAGTAGSGVAFAVGRLGNAQAGALTTIFDVNFLQTDANASSQALTRNLIGFIGNQVAPVPEPATWGMMIAGFGMMGAAMRTRRRSTKVSFA
jgi:hypothetical protein